MEYFKCDSCEAVYFTDAHEGFDCDCCPEGKIMKTTEEGLFMPGNFMPDVNYPCVSC